MRTHTPDFYKDGYSRVEFCVVCGAEGQLLRLECVGSPPDKNQQDLFEKDVDTDQEHH